MSKHMTFRFVAPLKLDGHGNRNCTPRVSDPIIHFAGFGRALSAPCGFKHAGQSAGRSNGQAPAPAPNYQPRAKTS
ncbi:hypothetical protein SKAU_G00301720 [Synaphobranchus kaupii]|uniref:Uncharacterized protein n=1 Tax=Synaphobranchus kaupii TaxID=118154 RepID=A0A9Q1EVW0_SYNKA|nr:hypothetical protein SKAU_G00301720 [Synaphobranchus kaupii]